MKYLFLIIMIFILLTACATPKKQMNQEPTQQEGDVENTAPTFRASPQSEEQDTPVKTDEEKQGSIGKLISNLGEAFTSGGTVKCIMQLQDAQTIMWIENQDLFSSENKIGTQTSYMLYKKPYVYIWSTENNQGFKINTDEIPENQQTPVQAPPSDPDEIEKLASEVNCVTQTAPLDAFTVPSGIEFLDFNAMMQNALQQ